MKRTAHILTIIAIVLAASLQASAQRKDGHWVDPVEYFKLKGSGRLSGDALYSKMWETKERYIVGMKCTVCDFDMIGDRDGAPPDEKCPYTAETAYLYINEEGAIGTTCNTGYGPIWKIGGTDLTFSFNEKTHSYSFDYTPTGTMSGIEDDKTYEPVGNTDIGLFYSEQKGLLGYLMVSFMTPDQVVDNGVDEEPTFTYQETEYYLRFKVEEVLLDGTDTPLTESERTALVDRINDLAEWLRGEGDPLGLGEHTDAMESAVIESVGIIGSILLANGVAAIGGGGGGSALGGLAGTGGGTPPPMPNVPDTPNIEAPDPNRKKEEEEPTDTPNDVPSSEEPPVEEPVNDGKFHATNYPGLCDQYIRNNDDGTLSMNDPITGKQLTYYPTADGKWESEMGTVYDNKGLEENLRYRYENSDVLKLDADQAAKNVAEQHQKWESDAIRDKERGYTDAMQEYRDWMKEKADEQLKKDYLQHLAEKYQVARPDEKVLKNAIRTEQQIAEWEHDDHMEYEQNLAEKEAYVSKIDKGAELAVNVMGECVPGGRVVKNAYTFAKSVGTAASESFHKGESGTTALKSIAYGAADGALGVLQNQAGNITNNALVEGTIVVGGESVRAGLNAISHGKSPEEISQAMADAGGKKLGYYLTGKAVSAGVGLVGGGGGSSVTPSGDVGTVEKYFGKSGMSGNWGNLDDKMFNNVNVTEAISSGVQETGATFGAYDKMGEIAKANEHDVSEFVKDVTEFSNRASKYRRR